MILILLVNLRQFRFQWAAVQSAIVNMSVSLGMRNVFEGVETIAELDIVKKLNGRVVQGYLYSKPLNVEDVDEWMTQEHKCVANYN